MTLIIAIVLFALALAMGFGLYLVRKKIQEIQEQIHYLNNEISKLKQQSKKRYYSKPKKQVIQG
jgi:Tfp pilus assembly protein PilN